MKYLFYRAVDFPQKSLHHMAINSEIIPAEYRDSAALGGLANTETRQYLDTIPSLVT